MHDTQETLFTWNKVKYLILTSLEATSSLSKPAAFVLRTNSARSAFKRKKDTS